jgi:hypothetical protein
MGWWLFRVPAGNHHKAKEIFPRPLNHLPPFSSPFRPPFPAQSLPKGYLYGY